jgi:hypothetical protein
MAGSYTQPVSLVQSRPNYVEVDAGVNSSAVGGINGNGGVTGTGGSQGHNVFVEGIRNGPGGTSVEVDVYNNGELIGTYQTYNAPLNTNGDPHGTNGQIPADVYTMTHSTTGTKNNHPALSNTGVPGRIRTPQGTIRTGVKWHFGTKPSHSRGCLCSPGFDQALPQLQLDPNYSNGSGIFLNLREGSNFSPAPIGPTNFSPVNF